MRINTNENSVRAQASLKNVEASRSKSLERLATALRINRASDDAAGLSVSESLRSMVRDNQMSQRNASDGLAMLQVAESGGQQITDSLQRMRELAIQSANGTLNDRDRKAIQEEFAQLQQHISGVAESTTYNGKSLLTGGASASAVSFQVSGSAGAGSTVSFANPTDFSGNLGLGKVDSAASARTAIAGIDKAIESMMMMRSGMGATMNRLDSTVQNLGNTLPNYVDAESRIRDTDFANETMKLMRDKILGQTSNAMVSQANQLPAGIMKLLGG